MPSRFILFAFAAALAGCASAPVKAPAAIAHPNLNATLWMQTSAEYAAVATQAFRQACAAFERLLQTDTVTALTGDEQGEAFTTRAPAAIVDLDETLLDNSAYQARRIRTGGGFTPESWTAWVNEARATAVPGALEYAQCAKAHGVTLVYISNRKAPEEVEATVRNLRELGFPLPERVDEVVLLRGDPRAPGREKGPRRQWVGERYRVIQLVGDNLGDFLDGTDATIRARQALTAPYAQWWGTRWIMLPNPSYGSWETALRAECGEAVDELACKNRQLRTE